MNGPKRLLLVAACVVGLLAVASALPAADPRIEGPTTGQAADGNAGDWESVVEDDEPAPPATTDDDRSETATPDESTPDPEIEVRGDVVPGTRVDVSIDHFLRDDVGPVLVNGDEAGTVDRFGDVDLRVPFAEEMTIEVPGEGLSRTVDVRTDGVLRTAGGGAPARSVDVALYVSDAPIPDAAVFRDGEQVATTGPEGKASVPLPPTAGPVNVTAERGPVTASQTVEVGEPSVAFTSPLLFPGFPVPVQVSAGGEPVPNATVSVVEGGSARTDENGRATVSLPIADEASVSVSVGEETASTTVTGLYLRLTALVVLVPGFVLGGVWTYFRYLPARRRRRHRAGVVDAFVGLADALGGLVDRIPRPSLPTVDVSLPALSSFGTPSLSLPTPSWPSIDLSLPRIRFWRGLDLALPGVGSGTDGTDGLGSRVRDWLREDEEPDAAPEDGDGDAPGLAPEPLGPPGPRAEVRAAWHAALDRLGVEDRETWTPGQVARHALATGFPATSVERLVTVFRDVEYGGRRASSERIAEARAAAESLLDHDPDEEGDGE